jgi:DnaJ family protein C protein 2
VDIILTSPNTTSTDKPPPASKMAISTEVHLPLPVLPQGWTGEKDFKAIGTVSKATQRSIEPVGPHFLAHARRARHKRTFSEDDRIQAQESVKKVEDDDAGEISEPEDPAMLMRDAKDWKVNNLLS